VDEFLARYPGYAATSRIDELRATEYAHLDTNGEVYLDYTGAGVYAESQLRAHYERVRGRAYGNPHSENPASAASTGLVESARRAVLRFLNAPADEYAVIFTANASAACRLVGESYRFGRGRDLVMTFDNHNSVNGIREFARRGGARRRYLRSSRLISVLRTRWWRMRSAGKGACSPFPRRATSLVSNIP
jgi:selenocysteine lyase/cysteine desulfurase